VILEPASRVGLSLEAGLLQRILGDITAEPGSLPLLEFALAEMWSRRDKSVLTNSGYDDIGELGGALATTAEAEFINLSPERQELAQRLFKRLVRASESGSDTRQPAHLDDLDPQTQEVKLVDFSRNYRDREEQRLKDLYAEAERTAGVMISEERGRPESRRDADPGSMLRLVRIIVASPGDVMSERDAIRSIIDELNRGIGREMGIVLQ